MNPNPLSLPGPTGPVFALDETWLQRGLDASRTSPRRRIIIPLQRRPEGTQRLLNFIQPGSYIRPHCHPLPEHAECITVLRGCLGVMMFSPEGKIEGKWRLEAGRASSCLVDLDHGVWHGIVALAADCVMLEAKRGPYNPLVDKKFAEWAPEEDSAGAGDCLRGFESVFDR